MLLRHKLLFTAVFFSVLLCAGVWTFLTPSEYRSTAAVVVRTNTNQQLFPSVGTSQRSQFIRQPAAELEFASSTFFASEANEGVAPMASVRPNYDDSDTVNRSSQIEFIALAPDPIDAQEAAAAWAEHYLETRAQNDIAEVDATIEGLEAQIADLELEKAELLAPIKPIDDALLVETDADVISRLTTQRLSLRQSLEDELLPISLQLRTLSQDLSNLRIASGYVRRDDNSARLAIEAPLGRQVAPQVERNLVLGAVLGVMTAVGLVLAYESYRGVINVASDLESLAPGTPVLSRLPAFPRGTDAPLALAAEAGSTYAQALERIVSTLLYRRVLLPGEQMSVLFTSAVPGEGKTTVASHLAMRLAATPTETIVVDADLRRPDIHTSFGFDQPKPGLSHLLQDGASLAPHLRRIQRLPRIRVLSAGAATDDAASLLRQAFGPALASLPADYDLLLIDAPPVLAVTDAEVMSRSVDGVVLIVRSGKTTRSQLSETLRKLSEAHATVIGFVLVAAVSNAANGYSNSYHYETDETTQRLASNGAPTMANGEAVPWGSAAVPALAIEPAEAAETRPLLPVQPASTQLAASVNGEEPLVPSSNGEELAVESANSEAPAVAGVRGEDSVVASVNGEEPLVPSASGDGPTAEAAAGVIAVSERHAVEPEPRPTSSVFTSEALSGPPRRALVADKPPKKTFDRSWPDPFSYEPSLDQDIE